MVLLALRFPWLLLGLVWGCVTDQNQLNQFGKLVEKSKESPPAWVDLEPFVFHQTGDELHFVSQKSKVVELPLGLKQAQILTYTRLLDELQKKFRQSIEKSLSLSGRSLESHARLSQVIQASLRSSAKSLVLIKDFYFETYRRRSPNGGMFDQSSVYVLATLPLANIVPVAKIIALRLKEESAKDLQVAGETLENSLKVGE